MTTPIVICSALLFCVYGSSLVDPLASLVRGAAPAGAIGALWLLWIALPVVGAVLMVALIGVAVVSAGGWSVPPYGRDAEYRSPDSIDSITTVRSSRL